jgi:hypothetical protein
MTLATPHLQPTRRLWLGPVLALALSGCSLLPRTELPPHPMFSEVVFQAGGPIKCGEPAGCTPPVEVNRTLVLIDVPGEPPPRPYYLWCQAKANAALGRTQATCVRVIWGTELK